MAPVRKGAATGRGRAKKRFAPGTVTLWDLIHEPRMLVALGLAMLAGLFIARTRAHSRWTGGLGGTMGRRAIPLRFKVGDRVYANYDSSYKLGTVAATWDASNAYRILLERSAMNVWARDDHDQYVKGVPELAVGAKVCVALFGATPGFVHGTVEGHHVGGSAYEVVLRGSGIRRYVHNDVEDLIRRGLRFEVGDRVWAKMDYGWVAGEVAELYPSNKEFSGAAYTVHLVDAKDGVIDRTLNIFAPLDDSTFVKPRRKGSAQRRLEAMRARAKRRLALGKSSSAAEAGSPQDSGGSGGGGGGGADAELHGAARVESEPTDENNFDLDLLADDGYGDDDDAYESAEEGGGGLI